MRQIIHGESLEVLKSLPAGFARALITDPPFGTGKTQKRTRIRTKVSKNGTRGGFGGRRYEVEELGTTSYEDAFDDYQGFLIPRIEAVLRCLTSDASIFVHLDDREVFDTKVALDKLLGRERFKQSIVWSYDFGGRPKDKYPAKHDIILWYVMDPKSYVFHYDEIDRIPYMAPDLVGAEKAAQLKRITACWWHTIVPTNGRERVGYSTQKPLGVYNRFIKVHTDPGDVVIDPFCGSGTTCESAALHGRGFVGIDQNPEAIDVMRRRLAPYETEFTEHTHD